MNIRHAQLDDVPAVTALALDFFNERGLPCEPRKVVTTVAEYINTPNSLVLLAEEQAEVVGVFIAFVDTNIFTERPFAQDRLVYVRPDKRIMPAAHGLFKGYVNWATERGCTEACFFASCSKDNESLRSVLEWLGCEVKGYMLRKCL